VHAIALFKLASARSGKAAFAFGHARSSCRSGASAALRQSNAVALRPQLCQTLKTRIPTVRPNKSLKLTRYGTLCKPGLRQSYHRRSPGLQSAPPRAA